MLSFTLVQLFLSISKLLWFYVPSLQSNKSLLVSPTECFVSALYMKPYQTTVPWLIKNADTYILFKFIVIIIHARTNSRLRALPAGKKLHTHSCPRQPRMQSAQTQIKLNHISWSPLGSSTQDSKACEEMSVFGRGGEILRIDDCRAQPRPLQHKYL